MDEFLDDVPVHDLTPGMPQDPDIVIPAPYGAMPASVMSPYADPGAGSSSSEAETIAPPQSSLPPLSSMPPPSSAPPPRSPKEEVPVLHDISFLNEVEVQATVELGSAKMLIRDVLKLRRGAVVELDKLVGQPADLLINHNLMAKGEIVVINERFGFRITKFLTSLD